MGGSSDCPQDPMGKSGSSVRDSYYYKKGQV